MPKLPKGSCRPLEAASPRGLVQRHPEKDPRPRKQFFHASVSVQAVSSCQSRVVFKFTHVSFTAHPAVAQAQIAHRHTHVSTCVSALRNFSLVKPKLLLKHAYE